LSGNRLKTTRTLATLSLMVAVISCRTETPQADSARRAGAPRISSAAHLSALTVPGGDFDFDSALVRKILDTAATLTNRDWDDKHDRIDQRRLLTGRCSAFSTRCEPGPLVRIIPRSNSHLTRRADLGAGHIVGMLLTREANGAIPYEKLALHQGTTRTYWWIGLHKVPSDTSIDTISVYVPENWGPGKPAKWRAVSLMDTDPGDPNFRHHRPMARFVWNDNDDETWVTCVTNGCCQPPAAMDTSLSRGKSVLDGGPGGP
jgi:hypothetical protein